MELFSMIVNGFSQKTTMTDVLQGPKYTSAKIWFWENLVTHVQFKKREKHPWRSDTFSKVAGFSQIVPYEQFR